MYTASHLNLRELHKSSFLLFGRTITSSKFFVVTNNKCKCSTYALSHLFCVLPPILLITFMDMFQQNFPPTVAVSGIKNALFINIYYPKLVLHKCLENCYTSQYFKFTFLQFQPCSLQHDTFTYQYCQCQSNAFNFLIYIVYMRK